MENETYTSDNHVEINIGGKTRKMIMDCNALANLKKATGKELADIIPRNTAIELKALRNFKNATGNDLNEKVINNPTDEELDALIQIEKELGAPYYTLIRIPSLIDIQHVIWACLREGDHRLAPSDVGAMMSLGQTGYYLEKITEAIKISMPQPKPKPGTENEEEPPLA